MISRLVSLSPVGTHHIQRDDANRILVIDNRLVKFTAMEYRFILPLLDEQAVSDTELAHKVFSNKLEMWMQENIDKHVDKIRTKLRSSGINVYRIIKYGYILLAVPD